MSTPKGSGGGLSISIGNLKEVQAAIKAQREGAERAVKRTVSDFKSRAPAWISSAVVEHYGIKKAEVKDAISGTKKAGSIKISGVAVDNIGIEYKGRLLTPTHFKMKPTKPPTKREKEYRRVPGDNVKGDAGDVAMVMPPAPYSVTAEIKKGKRVALGGDTFLGTNKGAGFIPFQRTGESRTALKSVKTVSVPQMITNEEVADKIRDNIDKGLASRLEHYLERELGKK